MSDDIFTDDERARESELTEPESPCCPLCGSTVWLPWSIHDDVICHNCGARLRFPAQLHVVNIPNLQAEIRIREGRA